MNTFGKLFRVTTFGESHGKLIGVVVDGCPAGMEIDEKLIQEDLNRRRPGQNDISTPRKEKDILQIMSGVVNGVSTGAPICMIIENKDKDSSKYDGVKVTPRPSHADFPALMKYGNWVDLRGSGRFSGRNTAAFVMAGGLAKQLLKKENVKIGAYTKAIYDVNDDQDHTLEEILAFAEKNKVRTINAQIADKMIDAISKAKENEDSVGGIITCIAEGLPAGIGEPMFESIESRISSAMFSIPAVKGIEFGIGFKAITMYGSEHNDPYVIEDNKVKTETNNAGGIIGGISTGMPVKFSVIVKPTASIGKEQDTVDLSEMKDTKMKIEGRHDPCIVPRAIPVVEAMTSIVLLDLMLQAGKIPRVL
ncbi:MAG: chorismate synthase [Candidatus Lokiarchaeota archaeon]|nr:chorismate synthase [Candidatus Lokiarchaeota archaeon]